MIDPAIAYIRHVLKAKDWTAADLARHAGVSHSTINRPLTQPDYPNAISRRTIALVAEASGIDPSAFMGQTQVSVPSPARQDRSSEETTIPIYNVFASAGPGAVVSGHEGIIDQLAFPPGYLRHVTKSNPRDLAIIGVKGDSMIPTLKDDDLVMLDMSKKDLSYEGLFVIRDGGEALLVKRIGRATRRGFVMIISDNHNVPAVERALDDIEVLGKVIWAGVKV